MYTVYVLYSKKHNKIYIGYTTDMEKRFLSHNELGTKGWTVKFRPWEIVYTEEYPTKREAMRREKELKGGKGREFIWKIDDIRVVRNRGFRSRTPFLSIIFEILIICLSLCNFLITR